MVLKLVVLALCVGIAMVEEMRGVITKVEGNKVTFTEMKGKEKGDTKTLPVPDQLNVAKGKYNKDTQTSEALGPLEDGLKADVFTSISENGVQAATITDGGTITEIRVLRGGKQQP